MNVFWLDQDHTTAARWYCDIHLNKIQLEIWEMISEVVRRHHCNAEILHQSRAHENHPLTVWMGDSRSQFEFAVDHFRALGHEWRKRKAARDATHWEDTDRHACQKYLDQIPEFVFDKIPTDGFQQPPEIVSDDCVTGNVVDSYRLYYANKKWPLDWFGYQHLNYPDWMYEYWSDELAVGCPRRMRLRQKMRAATRPREASHGDDACRPRSQ